MKKRVLFITVVMSFLSFFSGCDKQEIEEDAQITLGRRLFNDKKFSVDSSLSCGTCHPDGDMDNKKWHLDAIHDSTNNVPNAYSTPSLFGVADTPPYLWRGQGGTDLSVVTRSVIENIMLGTVTEEELDALTAYQNSLVVPANPWQNTDGSFTAAQERGRVVFGNQGKCGLCHSGPSFTNLQSIQIRPGQTLRDIPSLRWVFATAPYFHNHAATTLTDVVRYYADTVTTVQMTTWWWNNLGILDIELTEQEKADLVEYLKTL